ncbi:hypothetical protein N7478_007598 [Penicillium angulare]|uniref:uncharacterized protein n=1 Tax=Penicillium angulare TaxID=116970 RepID=UPI00254069EF|nr:uncharacterized protein N7478_007598 [Penicillium angulare]KAJ5272473.1 hypothetical protein N7478_007598 [Penicillium angulare]
MGLSAHVLEAPQTVIGYGMHDCDKRIEVHVGAGQTDRLLKLSNRKSQLLSSSMAPPHFSLSNWTLIAEHWETPTNRSDASVISEKHNATNNLHKLVSWKSIQGFQNASGVGYYTTKLTWLPASNVNVTADGAYLKLPKVTHALRVAVNGEYLPPVDYNAPRMDISKYLHTGQNEILAVVPTTMWNYIRSIFLDITNGGVSSYLVQAGSSYWPSMTDNGLIGNEEVDPIVKLEIEL